MIALIAVLALQATTSPPLQDGSSAQTPPKGKETPASETVVCRREHVVGSLRPIRICRTQREWAQLRDGSQEAIDRSNRPSIEALPKGGTGLN